MLYISESEHWIIVNVIYYIITAALYTTYYYYIYVEIINHYLTYVIYLYLPYLCYMKPIYVAWTDDVVCGVCVCNTPRTGALALVSADLCVRVYACVLVPRRIFIHTYIHTRSRRPLCLAVLWCVQVLPLRYRYRYEGLTRSVKTFCCCFFLSSRREIWDTHIHINACCCVRV